MDYLRGIWDGVFLGVLSICVRPLLVFELLLASVQVPETTSLPLKATGAW